MLESRTGLLKDELELLKRKESNGCNMEVVRRKVADAKGEENYLVDGSCPGTFHLYDNIRHSFYQKVLALGSRLRVLIDREAKTIRRSVHTALRRAAGGV